ncbi:MAG: NTP transferase domain-containing protein [Bacteroidales bacterium]|nr:NTP transferase domain-containing protein [Bacteroidales bacterium]
MNYAIIAAGEGSRLRKEGFQSVKPLVKVCGEYLIERLIRIFKDNSAESISVIINEESGELKSYLDGKDWGVKINLIVKSTPSSLHSFWNIINQTGITECCLTTVDTIFSEKDFQKYISCFQSNKNVDALMGVTKYIDDEKPLYVKTDDDFTVTAFCDSKETDDIDIVSAGIYCLRKKSIDKADDCIKANVSRMRNYQRSLIEAKLCVKAFLFSKVIDIDHVEDIKKAEKLITDFNTTVLCIKRYAEYSPNSQNKDEQIINGVADKLRENGFTVVCKEETQIDFQKEYYPLIVSMARNPEVIQYLHEWEKQGCRVINSSFACLNCYRETQVKILQNNNIPVPTTRIVKTDTEIKDFNELDILKNTDDKTAELWIKRGDFQTVEEIDVIKVASSDKANAILKNYNSRGIKTAVISENIEGDIIKFYGIASDCSNNEKEDRKNVLSDNFFYMTYPSKDKFNNDINVNKQRIEINKQEFILTCQKAAKVLGLDIYGGDAAVDKKGNFYIIDMNDFPSFSACRNQAAESIVRLVSNN